MRARSMILVSLLGLVLAACSSSPPPAPDSPALPRELLSVGTADGPLTVEVPSGSILFERDGALTSPDGRRVYSASVVDGRTVLRTNDAVSGDELGTTALRGAFDLIAVSPSGTSAALVDPLPEGWDPGVPVPRARTTIVIADPTGAREPETFDLRGNFEPEAFAIDDSSLFLIQYLPAEAPTAYRVAQLDLRLGDVFPVFGPYKGPAERMPGIRLEQVAAPDSNRLYTLYSSSRPGYAPHAAPVADSASVSFVHVLDLREGWAHCVGLPRKLWDRPAAEQAMAVSPDGSTLYVVDPSLGVLTAMDTKSLETTVVTDLSFGELPGERAAAQVSPDGSTLYVTASGTSTSLFALDVRTSDVVNVTTLDRKISSLGMSGDGGRLYAAGDSAVGVLDLETGASFADVPLPTDGAVLRIAPLAA